MYVRHRPRMVRQSVMQDLNDVLTALDWLKDPPLAMMQGHKLKVTDYVPIDAEYQGRDVDKNTLAVDQGTPSKPYQYELGGMRAQQYIFNFALYGNSDGTSLAILSDLSDRYNEGYLPTSPPTSRPGVELFNYWTATPTTVGVMDVESFEYVKSPEQVAPGVELYFAQLVLTDYLDPA